MRFHLVLNRRTWLPMLFAIVLLALAVVVSPTERGIQLSNDLLDRSRGSNVNQAMSDALCDRLDGREGDCIAGVICTTCTAADYAEVIDGESGGIELSGFLEHLGCGLRSLGLCDDDLTCVITAVGDVSCTTPEILANQPNGGGSGP